MWMLSELYEILPEAGDLATPKIVFFFDESHLLFKSAPKTLIAKVEQVARLVRSKGVGVYFITQSPSDIPDTVLAQLGNKIQHALRAYTPNEQKAVKAAAGSFRPNPKFNAETALGELGTGEALVSLLGEDGAPSVVERAKILPPRSYMGAADDKLIARRVESCALYGKYANMVDNESAFEQLSSLRQEEQEVKDAEARGKIYDKEREKEAKELERERARLEREKARAGQRTNTVAQRAITSTVSSIGREIGKGLIRGLFGTLRR
jgi:hypothetical protein